MLEQISSLVQSLGREAVGKNDVTVLGLGLPSHRPVVRENPKLQRSDLPMLLTKVRGKKIKKRYLAYIRRKSPDSHTEISPYLSHGSNPQYGTTRTSNHAEYPPPPFPDNSRTKSASHFGELNIHCRPTRGQSG
ncbi:hypothetical protein BDV32DRAFT_63012 [Aspergillus pseudonomiae]|nr:hypothetical protein BDV32DRAFT_63012 [Aspergillus pseudonomiae]